MGTDQRDQQTWVTLELTYYGQQRVEEGALEDDLLEALNAPFHWPVFVPARTYLRSGNRVTVNLYEGYAFVGTGFEERRYFSLERSAAKIVKQVMSSDTAEGIRVLHTIHDSHIKKWQSLLRDEIASDIHEGMRVRITEGKLSNLEADVLDVDGEFADIIVRLRSAHGITRLPRYFLDVVDVG